MKAYTLEQKEYFLDQVKKVPVVILLQEVWPNGLVLLFRDDGWFAHWQGDEKEPENEYEQKTNESFEDFIWRALADILAKEKPDKNGNMSYQVDFAICQAQFLDCA